MADTLPNTDQLPELDVSQYRLTPKFEKWRQLYLDESSKETFGNATQSALRAYNLDPATQTGSAAVIGHENLRKLNNLRTIVGQYLEEHGFTLPVFINHALQKMAASSSDRWWRNLLLLAGYIDPKQTIINNSASAGASAAAQATNNEFIQIAPEEEKKLSRDFADFLDGKYRGKPAMNPDAPNGVSG